MKKKQVLGLLLALVLIAGVLIAVYLTRPKPETTTEVKRGDIAEAVYGLGTVEPAQTYQVKIAINATIKKIFVTEGQAVEKGNPLVRLDEGMTFAAPFAGTITAIPFKVGELVGPQTPVITLMNLRDRYVLVSLEQESAMRVRPTQEARISFETMRGEVFRGQVRSVYPGDGEFLVRIDFDDLPPEILPGMTGDVAIKIDQKNQVLLVPVNAIQMGRVMVRQGHFTKKIPITVGVIDGHWAEVVSGSIKSGDRVVVRER